VTDVLVLSSHAYLPSLFYPLPPCSSLFILFFSNDTATTEIYTLSLHDALPISLVHALEFASAGGFAHPQGPRRPRHRLQTGQNCGRRQQGAEIPARLFASPRI